MKADLLLDVVMIIRSVFEHRPEIWVVVITLVVFTALLWLNIGVVNLWNKRKR